MAKETSRLRREACSASGMLENKSRRRLTNRLCPADICGNWWYYRRRR